MEIEQIEDVIKSEEKGGKCMENNSVDNDEDQ